MRLVFLVTQLEAGGAQTAAIKLSQGFRKRGYEVETWFLYKKREAFQDFENKICLLNKPPESFVDYLKIWYRIYKRLAKHQPDALFTFTHYANVIGQFSAWLAGIDKRIASQRNPNYNYPKFVRIADKIFGTSKVYTDNVMVSNSVKNTFEKYPLKYLNKSKVIYNGIEKKKANVSIEKALSRLNIGNDKFIFLNVGRLSKQKNQKVIINAISKIKDAVLIILGEGEERENLEFFIKKNSVSNVVLAGEVSQQEVVNLMSAANVFLISSKFEGMSNALLESMVLGLPVIATDIPPNREVLSDGGKKFGMLLPADQIQQWSNAMNEMISNQNKRDCYSKLSVQRSEMFTLKIMIDEFEKLVL